MAGNGADVGCNWTVGQGGFIVWVSAVDESGTKIGDKNRT